MADESIRQAAIERLEAFAADLEHLGMEDFRQMALAIGATAQREALRREAERIAAAAGMDDVLARAQMNVGDYLLRAYGAGTYRPTWVELNWGISLGPTADRVAAAQAVQDAATAIVVEEIAPPEVTEPLRAPFDLIASVHPLTTTTDAAPSLTGLVERGNPIATMVASMMVMVAILAIAFGLWPLAAVFIALVAFRTRRRARRGAEE